MIGWNARIDGLQGAVLNVKLKHLDSWTEARRNNAKIYNDLLNQLDGLIDPHEAYYAKHVYHLYAIRVQNREKLMTDLSEKDIYCGIHYPIAVHLQEAYSKLGYNGLELPVSEKAAAECLSLPMFPELSYEQQENVQHKIQDFLTR